MMYWIMLRFAVLACLAFSALRAAAPALDPQVAKDWMTSKEFTLAVAGAMPADKYGYQVAPEEMPFAALMIHIADSQAYRFAQISGKPIPFEVPKTIDKMRAKEISKQLLAQSFDFCIGLLAEFTPEQMDKLYEVGWYERPKITGRELVLGMFIHTAHHRGQAEVYLRANGIKPPAYRF
jgi:uncharacterized damage-inducible protein DinB